MKFPLRAAFKLELIFYIYIDVLMSLVISLLTTSSALLLLKEILNWENKRKHVAELPILP